MKKTISMKYTGKIPVGVPALGRSLHGNPIEPGEVVQVPEKLSGNLKKDRNWKMVIVKDSNNTTMDTGKKKPDEKKGGDK